MLSYVISTYFSQKLYFKCTWLICPGFSFMSSVRLYFRRGKAMSFLTKVSVLKVTINKAWWYASVIPTTWESTETWYAGLNLVSKLINLSLSLCLVYSHKSYSVKGSYSPLESLKRGFKSSQQWNRVEESDYLMV